MQPRTSILSLALAALALAAPTAAAEPQYDGTYIVLAYENGNLTAIWHVNGYSFNNMNQSSFVANPTDWSISIDVYNLQMGNAMRMWDTSNMAIYYPTACEVVKPGVNPDRFLYVFVIIQEECLIGPSFSNSMVVWRSGPSSVVYYDGPCGVVNPGVDPNRFPYVFVTFQPECLEPLISGFPPGMEAEWRW